MFSIQREMLLGYKLCHKNILHREGATNSLVWVTMHQIQAGSSLASFALTWQPTASIAQAQLDASQPSAALQLMVLLALLSASLVLTASHPIVQHRNTAGDTYKYVPTNKYVSYANWCIFTAAAFSCCQIKHLPCCSYSCHCSVGKTLVNV